MSMLIRLNGQNYDNFTSASVFRSIETVAGSFSFTSTFDANNEFPINGGDAVEVSVEGGLAVKGFVEGFTSDSAPDSHDISVSGRDVLGDLVDSTVGEIKEFTGRVTLKEIARAVLAGINLPNVPVVDLTGGTDTFEFWDITSAEVGQPAFDFLESFARKSQVLLTTNGAGTLVLTRASSDKYQTILRDGDGGNIIRARKDIDFADRFNTYTCHSQLNLINLEIGTTPAEAVQQKGLAVDGDIRASRIFSFNAEESSDSFTAKNRATWEANFRRAESLRYNVVVQGHGVDGTIWEPNMLVDVNDAFNDISSTLMIRSVRFDQSVDGGETTLMELTYRDAYRLQAEQTRRDALAEE